MSGKVRLEITVSGYRFKSFPGLVFHSGEFWLNDERVKQVFNNGSRAVLIGGTKRGIKKLRKEAVPCTVKLFEFDPF